MPAVCLNLLCLFYSYIIFFIFHASVVHWQGRQSVKLRRFRAMKVRIFPDAPIFVSETQPAECRSSKPDVAGSIPVAHSNQLQARSLTGKTPVSKTGLLCSNQSVPANFLQRAKKHVISSPHSSQFSNLPGWVMGSTREGKPKRYGSSLESCREKSPAGSSPVPSSNLILD